MTQSKTLWNYVCNDGNSLSVVDKTTDGDFIVLELDDKHHLHTYDGYSFEVINFLHNCTFTVRDDNDGEIYVLYCDGNDYNVSHLPEETFIPSKCFHCPDKTGIKYRVVTDDNGNYMILPNYDDCVSVVDSDSDTTSSDCDYDEKSVCAIQ